MSPCQITFALVRLVR